jgi:predicted ArsR family transcriptional regulator
MTSDDLLARSFTGLGVSIERIAVLNALLRDGERSVAALAEELGLTPNAAWRHLVGLERANLARRRRATHPRGVGRITYWSADRNRALQAVDEFEDELLRGVDLE